MKIPLTPIRFLERAETQFGNKTGVIDGQRRWSYRQYAGRCRQLANLLKAFELRPGGRAAFLSFNTHHLLEAYYGVNLAGGVFLPLNIRLSPEDVAYILNDSGAEILFFHRAFLPILEEIRPELRSLRLFVALDDGKGPDWVRPESYERLLGEQPSRLDFDFMNVDEDEVAEIFYTSGTTSRPKGVMLTHRNLYLHALEAGTALGGGDGDVQLHTIPLFHVNGWGIPQLLTCLGGTHVMINKFEPAAVLERIQAHRVTLMCVVPTMATALLNHPGLSGYDVSSMRRISIGGAASNPTLVRDVERAFGCECVTGYGLTETCPVLTISLIKESLQLDQEERYRVQAMTGYPMPGVEVKIVDERGRDLPWDGVAEGEIVARGDGVMKGYWNKPEDTAEAMRGGWFHTGDTATINPEGYVTIVDRKKDIIISGGENISSIELENAVLAHDAVLECAVIPVPDPKWGEVPKALVALKPGRAASEEEILNHCRPLLAGFKMPKSVDFLPELPKGGTGKILKRLLRENYWAGQEKRVH